MSSLNKGLQRISQNLNTHNSQAWWVDTTPPTQVIVNYAEGEARAVVYPEGTSAGQIQEVEPLADYVEFIPGGSIIKPGLISKIAANAVQGHVNLESVRER